MVWPVVLGLVAGMLLAPGTRAATPAPALDATERAWLQQMGPWPPPATVDPANRFSGRANAVALGRRLFNDPALSASGRTACASCHQPQRHFSDGLALPASEARLRRHTPSLVDVRGQRWFGWVGAHDSLWAASLSPLIDPHEMGPEREVAQRLRANTHLWRAYRQVRRPAPSPTDDTELLVDVARLLAAYQETLVSPRTAFDHYRDAVLAADTRAAARYPVAAVRGLRLFVGRARCVVCHLGPAFTNREFDQVGIGVRTASGAVDGGRYDGAKAVLASRFNALREHARGVPPERVELTRRVNAGIETRGLFRVPGLRGLAHTAPYMHDGRLATLHDVVKHYATLDEERIALAVPHSHDELDLSYRPPPPTFFAQPLNLSEREIGDLVAFLRSLSAP